MMASIVHYSVTQSKLFNFYVSQAPILQKPHTFTSIVSNNMLCWCDSYYMLIQHQKKFT